jgi:AraC-like DNA-binding protein
MPAVLDIVVPLNFLIYGGKLQAGTAQDCDSLPGMRLESGELPRRLWRAIAFALLASAVCDGLIFLDQVLGNGDWLPVIVSLFTSANLLVMGALSMSQELTQSRHTEPTVIATDVDHADNTQRDAQIMLQVDRLMYEERLFLDADLTLTRLARKLCMPAKQVSAAINAIAGENVSRHVNRYRIDYACQQLLDGKSITQTIYESGFNTKSNFNREFLRLKLASPSDWLATQSAA